jgi:hypothetical protein
MYPHRLSKPKTIRRLRPLTALAAFCACLALAACGSSASSSTSTASTGTTAASASSAPKGAPGAGGGRFASVRSCLAKQGITLPARSGTRPPGGTGAPGGGGGGGPLGGGGGGGGLSLPKGVTRTQLQEAMKKCGGGNLGGGGRFASATGKAALTKFVACMRENGVALPAPNTSGTGPVFNTKEVNTNSAAFKSASAKCQPALQGAGPGGGAGGPGAGSAG